MKENQEGAEEWHSSPEVVEELDFFLSVVANSVSSEKK